MSLKPTAVSVCQCDVRQSRPESRDGGIKYCRWFFVHIPPCIAILSLEFFQLGLRHSFSGGPPRATTKRGEGTKTAEKIGWWGASGTSQLFGATILQSAPGAYYWRYTTLRSSRNWNKRRRLSINYAKWGGRCSVERWRVEITVLCVRDLLRWRDNRPRSIISIRVERTTSGWDHVINGLLSSTPRTIHTQTSMDRCRDCTAGTK